MNVYVYFGVDAGVPLDIEFISKTWPLLSLLEKIRALSKSLSIDVLDAYYTLVGMKRFQTPSWGNRPNERK